MIPLNYTESILRNSLRISADACPASPSAGKLPAGQALFLRLVLRSSAGACRNIVMQAVQERNSSDPRLPIQA